MDFAIKAENITKIFHKTRKTSFTEFFAQCLSMKKDTSAAGEFVTAIDDISFELKKGCALGVIGNNGAGKSTLLKILSGISKPTSGNVFIDGEVSAFLDMGVALVPELSGKENIFIYGELQGLQPAHIKRMYSSIVEFSEIGEYIDTPVKYYSMGMLMRLAFAVVAHSDKDILLFDEAFEVGDVFFRAKCQKWLYGLRSAKKTIILISHNLNEIANFCDHLILLNKGKITARGNPGEVIKQYNDLYYKKGAGSKGLIGLYDEAKKTDNKIITEEVHWYEDQAPSYAGCKIIGVQLFCDPSNESEDSSSLKLRVLIKSSGFKGDIGFTVNDFLDYKIMGDLARYHIEDFDASVNFGDSVLMWTLPRNLLNSGIYKISLYLFDSSHMLGYLLFDILTFEVLHKNDKEQTFYIPLRTRYDFSINKA